MGKKPKQNQYHLANTPIRTIKPVARGLLWKTKTTAVSPWLVTGRKPMKSSQSRCPSGSARDWPRYVPSGLTL